MSRPDAGVGGPNIPPPEDGPLAECVSHSPGGPTHVLLSDREAEHIPGCNMAFRKSTLEEIGGFDPQFHIAGDDVDICWRIQDAGYGVGFSAGAVVWHHRRNSVKAYLRQQYEYGKAEALLERKWPDRYNRVGHLAWSGRVYGNGSTLAMGWRRWKIYYGMWGTGLFQSVYQRTPAFASLPLVPEWYLVILALATLSALGLHWAPLLLALPLLLLATGALVFESALGAARATFRQPIKSRFTEPKLKLITLGLHMLQPVARLSGRLRYGLAPWRRRSGTLALPIRRNRSIWDERWKSADQRLKRVDQDLRAQGCVVRQGSEYDRWDLEVRGGMLGVARLRVAVEEHGAGRQLVRFCCWPKYSQSGLALAAACAALSVGAILQGALDAFIVLAAVATIMTLSALRDCATAIGVLLPAIEGRARVSARKLRQLRRSSRGFSVDVQPEAPSTLSSYVSDNGHAGAASANGHDPLVSENGRDADSVAARLEELPPATSVVRFSPND